MQNSLILSDEEQGMIRGDQGIAVRRAIEIIVALAKIYGASRLVPVTSVQVAGVSYKNLGEAGLEFLHAWAAQGAQVRVPTTLNPAGIDLKQWKKLGFDREFADRQQAVIKAYTSMGIIPTCTCTPYLVGNRPEFGQHIAWAESSAVSFANSVLGARTNREGGPSALAAAICGRTAAYGYHLEQNRIAQVLIEVHCPLTSTSDWSALGYLVGRRVHNKIPYFFFPTEHPLPTLPGLDQLKSLGAAMAASGAVALYHIAGITPEAKSAVPDSDAERIIVNDLRPGYNALNLLPEPGPIDLVSIGCPHASLDEIHTIARTIAGRAIKASLWVTTSQEIKDLATADVAAIEHAGGHIVADTCMVVAPIEKLGYKTMVTNSAKMAFYTPSHSGLSVRFGTLEQCIDAAVSGSWVTRDEK